MLIKPDPSSTFYWWSMKQTPACASLSHWCQGLCLRSGVGMGEPEAAEQTSEHEPLRQQEERSGEHAGCGSADGQRLAAEGRARTRAGLHLLPAPHRSHQHLPRPSNPSGSHAHLHRWAQRRRRHIYWNGPSLSISTGSQPTLKHFTMCWIYSLWGANTKKWTYF